MSHSKLSQRELLILIEADCDVGLSQSDANRLEQAILDNPLAEELYQKYILLDAELYWKQIKIMNAFPWSQDPADKTNKCDPVVLSLGDGQDFDSLIGLPPVGFPESETIAFEALPAKDFSL